MTKRRLTAQEKLANKNAKHKRAMSEFVSNALDKNKALSCLKDNERFLRVLFEQGSVSKEATNTFGSPEHPLTLSLDSVHDKINCERCGHENEVYRRDIPHISSIIRQFANGMANEFRRLKEIYGLRISKNGEVVVVEGILPVNEEEVHPSIPAPVQKYWRDEVGKGDLYCPHQGNDHRCSGLLTNSPRNWHLDHKLFSKDNPSYKVYHTDDEVRNEPGSYEPVCTSCSSDDREEVKPFRKDFLDQDE